MVNTQSTNCGPLLLYEYTDTHTHIPYVPHITWLVSTVDKAYGLRMAHRVSISLLLPKYLKLEIVNSIVGRNICTRFSVYSVFIIFHAAIWLRYKNVILIWIPSCGDAWTLNVLLICPLLIFIVSEDIGMCRRHIRKKVKPPTSCPRLLCFLVVIIILMASKALSYGMSSFLIILPTSESHTGFLPQTTAFASPVVLTFDFSSLFPFAYVLPV